MNKTSEIPAPVAGFDALKKEDAEIASPSTLAILRRKTGVMDKTLNITNLPTDQYKELLQTVDTQMGKIIKQAITLQERKVIIDKMILSESILFLILNSCSTLVATSDDHGNTKSRNSALYFMFAIGLIASCMSLVLKWVKNRQEKDIENYRTSIKDIVSKYGADAWFRLEKQRMSLPSEVLASGFFRGLDENLDKVEPIK